MLASLSARKLCPAWYDINMKQIESERHQSPCRTNRRGRIFGHDIGEMAAPESPLLIVDYSRRCAACNERCESQANECQQEAGSCSLKEAVPTKYEKLTDLVQ